MSEEKKGEDTSFKDGIEHVAIHYTYSLDTGKLVEKFRIPRDAQKLMR